MRLVTDLHIHSKHSIATSGAMDLPQLAQWAARKGIELLGTGDFTHGGWLGAIERELRPTGAGLLAARNGVLFGLMSNGHNLPSNSACDGKNVETTCFHGRPGLKGMGAVPTIQHRTGRMGQT